MRKLLSFALAFCLLLSACLVMASCSKVSEAKMEENPAAVLGSAMKNTTAQFFTDTANISSTVSKAMKSGALSISLEADLLKEFSIGKITETLYMNEKDKTVVSDTLVNYNGEDLAARLFVNQNGIIVNSESILGSDTSYGLFPATLAEKFTDSDIAKLMGLTDEESIAAVNEALASIADAYKQAFDIKDSDGIKMANELLKTLKLTTSEQKLTTEDGATVDCVVASCKFTNATYEAYLKLSMEQMGITDEEIVDSMNESISSMSDEVDLDLTIDVFVNQKKGNCEKISITGSITDKFDDEAVEIDASITFSQTAIALRVAVEEDGETVTINADLTKEETKDGVTYQFTVKYKEAGTSVTVAKLTADYAKDSGKFTVTLKLPQLLDENIVLKGKITSDKTSATISFNSVEYNGIEIEMKLDITFDASAEIPKTPADVKDVVELTEEDLANLVEDFQSSKLGSLIFGYAGDMDEYYAA